LFFDFLFCQGCSRFIGGDKNKLIKHTTITT
jgi:hypothetical protein